MNFTHQKLWYDGANHAADAVVLAEDSVLLIKRRDSGRWALPGGFVEKNESSIDAAVREAREETNINVTTPTGLVYSGKVEDRRNTVASWIETDAYLFELPAIAPAKANDDASEAAWVAFKKASGLLASTHLLIFNRALAYRHNQNYLLSIFGQPTEHLTRRMIHAGHMAYEHVLVTDSSGRQIFAKIHDATRFHDVTREKHSKQYLHKEQLHFDYLRAKNYLNVPASSTLVDDSILLMDGLAPEHGWQWEAPAQDTERYVQECLEAIATLESIPLPYDDSLVVPTLASLRQEGWESFGDTTAAQVRERVSTFSSRMNQPTQKLAQRLLSDIATLRAHYNRLETSVSTVYTHHDMRSSNIAWHPTHGVKVIDWSWAGPGRPKSDRTSLLIDLAKNGHDVSSYVNEHFNADHALELIGFWLASSLRPNA